VIEVGNLIWSPNGKYITSTSTSIVIKHGDKYYEKHNTLNVWDVDSGSPIFTNDRTEKFQLFIIEDEEVIVANDYSTFAGTRRRKFWSPTVMCWSPNEQLFAIAPSRGGVEIWDVVTSGINYSYNLGPIEDIAWSPDGMYLAVVTSQRNVLMWNAHTGECVWKNDDIFPTGKKEKVKVDLSPIIRRNWSREIERIDRVRLKTNRESEIKRLMYELHEIENKINQRSYTVVFAWSPDGSQLSFAGGKERDFFEFEVWDVRSHKLFSKFTSLHKISRGNKKTRLNWSPDMQNIFLWHKDWWVTGRLMEVWNIHTGKIIYDSSKFLADLSPDGMHVATTNYEKTLQLQEVNSGMHLFTYPGYAGKIRSIVWSPDGKRLAIVLNDSTIQILQA
jgi:WD40 repeat protein